MPSKSEGMSYSVDRCSASSSDQTESGCSTRCHVHLPIAAPTSFLIRSSSVAMSLPLVTVVRWPFMLIPCACERSLTGAIVLGVCREGAAGAAGAPLGLSAGAPPPRFSASFTLRLTRCPLTPRRYLVAASTRCRGSGLCLSASSISRTCVSELMCGQVRYMPKCASPQRLQCSTPAIFNGQEPIR